MKVLIPLLFVSGLIGAIVALILTFLVGMVAGTAVGWGTAVFMTLVIGVGVTLLVLFPDWFS